MLLQRCEEFCGIGYPAKDAALRLDHLEARLLEFREVGAHTIGRHQAIVAAIIGFSDGGIDTHLGGDARDDELFDATILEDGVEVSGPEGAFAGFVDDRFAGGRIEFGDDIVSRLSANQNASHGTRISYAAGASASHPL